MRPRHNTMLLKMCVKALEVDLCCECCEGVGLGGNIVDQDIHLAHDTESIDKVVEGDVMRHKDCGVDGVLTQRITSFPKRYSDDDQIIG